jgi:Putative MetA-pathway of phenol degradation
MAYPKAARQSVAIKGLITVCVIPLALTAVHAGHAAEDRPVPAPDDSSTVETEYHAAGPGKSQFNLFNPTPNDALRPFSTDRPGKTHSSLTVDAGHLQVEGDFWNYSWDHWTKDGTATRAYTVLNPNLKVGITNSTEFDMFFPVYNSLEIKDPNDRFRASGFGDILVGGKINFFGNDGGDRALGAIGFIKLPTAAHGLGNNMVEYLLNLPYTMALPNKFSVTFEPAIGLIRNLNKQGYQGDYQFLINLNRPIINETVTAALEIALDFPGDHDIGPRHTLDPSLQWLVTPNLQLDVGIFIGLTKAAPDWNPYVGLSYRY